MKRILTAIRAKLKSWQDALEQKIKKITDGL
jgi:hypothetical protein